MNQPPRTPPASPVAMRARWIATGIAALLVVLTAVVVTVRSDDPSSATAATTEPAPVPTVSDAASAGDDAPVSLVTEDPTCEPWQPLYTALSAQLANGWHQRDPATAPDAWTDAQRRQFRAVGDAMRRSAADAAPLARSTPHRVMRELYEQAIAYWRAYSDSLDDYRPAADHLARAATNAAEAVNAICAAIDFGSATSRSRLLLPGPAPVPPQSTGDPSRPARYVTEPSAFCDEWTAMVSQYAEATRAWRERLDTTIPATYWSPEQRALGDDVAGVMQNNADRTQLLGVLSGNLVAADFAALSAHYRRAYALAIPTFALPDTHLDNAALRLQALTNQACLAVRR